MQNPTSPEANENKFQFPRQFARKVSVFLFREMLLDYVQDRLDPERRRDMDLFLSQNPDSQAELQAFNKAVLMVDQLAQTRLSGALQQHLLQSENLSTLGRKYAVFKNWPDTLRWSTMAIATSVFIAFSVAQIPWARLTWFQPSTAPDTVELAALPNLSNETSEEVPPPSEGDDKNFEIESSGDFDGPVAIAADKPTSVAKSEPPEEADSMVSKAGNTVAETPPTPQPAAAKPKGFVYRAFMSVTGVEEMTPKLASEIKSLGGNKAGEVKLGWRRGKASYFHFSIPESNEGKLLEVLRAYGPVRISKDPHSRIMPQGQVRFILWVEPAN